MEPLRFRREFVGRLMRIARSSTLGLAASAVACGASEHTDQIGTTHGSTGGASGTGGRVGAGGSSASSGMGGVGTTGGTGGISLGGTAGVFDASAGSGGTGGTPELCKQAVPGDGGEQLDASSDAWRGELICLALQRDDAGACPNACNAVADIGCIGFSTRVIDVAGGPYPMTTCDAGAFCTACCYDVITEQFPCYVGRTFFIDEGVVTAELRNGEGWRTGPRPAVDGLDRRTRDALGEAWARDGLFEHASVASFARFVMQLLAVGAPADLVRDAHAAAVDEVAHAELSLALASEYLGRSVEPSALPFNAALEIEPDLAAIAFETVMEGCIGETVATLQALDALEHATDPAVRQVLERTVYDEARHAELAWRFMAWALSVGGARTHFAIARAFEAFRPPAARAEDLSGVDGAAYRAHGRQPAAEARAIAERVLTEVVRPVSQALLATSTSVTECARLS